MIKESIRKRKEILEGNKEKNELKRRKRGRIQEKRAYQRAITRGRNREKERVSSGTYTFWLSFGTDGSGAVKSSPAF
ncbi:hypothetical protein ASPWEDRAFT_37352 [Aspergillus wentii DTO 134E9]|uniref:Uncharacterized protein n=1 Tax=Aspergillus wentii DTO 134E9 TaxID=1073089 RepID=A0A1L9RX75_ASPWE|nr:uncharacterized protein ASPWEDRAFT_37352 [Aspergillus wentii DTO 134E9]OJJ39551.1 hypothetical protein ASPWEDRAFT_37352 [Aspergillus wentii DTO 134E9]